MRKNILRYFWNPEFVVASVLVMIMVRLLYVISDNLPDTDSTSFLDPIFSRIDFLNIKDVSLDAIFATKDMKFSDERIIVVNLGESAPTPDGKIALLLYKAKEWGAKVVGIDVFFDALHFERFPKERQFEVGAIKQALHDVPNVVLVNGYDENQLKPVIRIDSDIVHSVKHFGYANLTADDDGVVRRFYPYRTIDGSQWLSFPIKILERYNPKLIESLLRLPEEEEIIYFTGTYDQFYTYPIDDVIADDRYKSNFKDAIVLVGLVNEKGLVYLGDMHKTPMGRRTVVHQMDESTKIGLDGPDMAGVLIHANVVNMLLKHQFIFPVPAWVDWLLVFVLSYISVALYRVLRVKPATKLGIGFLISAFLIIETIVVFFLPMISFFYLGVKISYHLMSTAVLLFIPANALSTKLRYALDRNRIKMKFANLPAPVIASLLFAFKDDETFPSYIGCLHASQVFLHYAFAIEAAKQIQMNKFDYTRLRYPQLHDWCALVPTIDHIRSSDHRYDRWQHFFYSYLAGKKSHFLRDSEVKNLFLSTQYDHYNEHMYYEEWDVLIPHIMQMYDTDLKQYHDYFLFDIQWEQDGRYHVESIGFSTATPKLKISESIERRNGLYISHKDEPNNLIALSPLCEYTECKLHRKKELFVFAGLLRKQFTCPPLPAYYGQTISCEPVLHESAIEWFRTYLPID